MRYKWTKERIEILKNMYSTCEWEDIYKALDLYDKERIISKCSDLKIKKNNYFYSEEDIAFLRKNYKKMTVKKMANCIGKTEGGVATALRRYKINKDDDYTEQEKQLLKKIYPYYTNKYIIEKFFPNKNKYQIAELAKRLGVNHKVKRNKKYDKEDIINKFRKYIDEGNEIPTYNQLKELSFPSSKTFERYFGGYRTFIESMGYTPNKSIFGKSKMCKCKDGRFCYSKKEKIISDFLIENNISYEKEVPYSKFIPKEICGDRRFDWVVGNICIEYFGMIDKPYYLKRTQEKIDLCNRYNINLICIYPNDMPNKFKEKLNILTN